MIYLLAYSIVSFTYGLLSTADIFVAMLYPVILPISIMKWFNQ